MQPEMLTELLAGRHINMSERIARGAWPHEPLRFADLVAHLAGVISRQDWFPRVRRERRPDEPVVDTSVIERQSDSRYVVHFQQAGALMNLVAEGQKVFEDPVAAAECYLRAELRLPGDLDGWKVI